MRIVAGEFKGKQISAPPGDVTRPTIDRVREALFSSLYSLLGSFEGLSVLDAFAGSGALGLEALSRGVTHVCFVDSDRSALKTIEENIARCNANTKQVSVCRCDIRAAKFNSSFIPFDIVFLDPPYKTNSKEIIELLNEWENKGVIDEGTLIVYEHDQSSTQEVEKAIQQSGRVIRATKNYGRVAITIIQEEK